MVVGFIANNLVGPQIEKMTTAFRGLTSPSDRLAITFKVTEYAIYFVSLRQYDHKLPGNSSYWLL